MKRELILVPVAVGCWASAGLLIGFPADAHAVAWACALLCGALLLVALLRRHGGAIALIAVMLAVAALVAVVVAVRAPQRQPDELVALGSERSVAVTAVVTSAPVFAPSLAHTMRFRVELLSARSGDTTLAVRVPVLVFAEAPTSEASPSPPKDSLPRIGALVQLSGNLARTEAGDSSSFLLFARGDVTVLRAAEGPVAWAAELRSGLVQAAVELPGAGGLLLPGLAIGDTSAVDAQLDADMKASSLSHLTAVSGANCALVVAAGLALGAALGLTRRWKIVLALGLLAAFVVLVTPEGSVVRAAVMAAIVLLALASGRPSRGVPALCLAVVVLLVIDPWMARNFGFALSVLATGGLLLLSAPIARALARWMPQTLATVIALPLAAQLACQPVLVLIAPVVALYGVPANLLAAPAAPLATVVGLVGCLLLPMLPWFGAAVLWLAWLPAAWIAAVAAVFSALPASQIPWLGGALGAFLTTVGGVLALIALLGSEIPRAPWLRPACALILSALLVCSLAAAGASAIVRSISRPASWLIAACDVGQGDALLVRGNAGVMLIDTGPEPEPLRACLDSLGVTQVAILVLTHFDLDHVGGVSAVSGRVTTVLFGPSDVAKDEAIIRELRSAGAETVAARSGDRGALGDLGWEVMWPPRAAPGVTESSGNSASVVVQTEVGGIRSIFLGDLGEEAELRLTPRVGAVDVVKVAHHGSADQSARLYERLGARLALISVGADNDYGHPAASILDTLRGTGAAIARTDRAGMVLVSGGREAGELGLWSEREESSEPRAAVGWNLETREARGCSSECVRHDEKVSDCAACLEPGAAGAHRSGVWNREVLGRARDPPAA